MRDVPEKGDASGGHGSARPNRGAAERLPQRAGRRTGRSGATWLLDERDGTKIFDGLGNGAWPLPIEAL